jgi:pilus assembly protein FimV
MFRNREEIRRIARAISFAMALAAIQAHAQTPPAKVTVTATDTVMVLAKKYRPKEATLNQMALALVRENPNAFEVGSQRQLKVGYEMQIPAATTVTATDKAVADKEMARLAKADRAYRAGVAAEKKGDMKTAMRSYLTAAHMGHGLADLRLGQLYDWDPSGKVPHDLQESLFFYREARKRGITIEGPIPMRKDFGPS